MQLFLNKTVWKDRNRWVLFWGRSALQPHLPGYCLHFKHRNWFFESKIKMVLSNAV